jgi:hypothetical protein
MWQSRTVVSTADLRLALAHEVHGWDGIVLVGRAGGNGGEQLAGQLLGYILAGWPVK